MLTDPTPQAETTCWDCVAAACHFKDEKCGKHSAEPSPAPQAPDVELAQRLIRNTKGWMQERIRELESALTAAREAVEYWRDKYKHEEARWCKAAAEVGRVREERDRAQEALLFMYESFRGRLMNEEKDKVLRALKTASDRQPEGETK